MQSSDHPREEGWRRSPASDGARPRLDDGWTTSTRGRPTPEVVSSLAGGRHVLLGVSGGIAAYKAASLARGLLKAGATVQAVLTAAATEFVGPATFEGLTGRPCTPASSPTRTGSACTPGTRSRRRRVRAGDRQPVRQVRARPGRRPADSTRCLTCPVVVAPAMHTEMWLHPATQANVATLRRRGAVRRRPRRGPAGRRGRRPGRLVDEDVSSTRSWPPSGGGTWLAGASW